MFGELLMRKYLFISAVLLITAGCAGKTIESFDLSSQPATPPGWQRFVGISDEHCENEADAYRQAWSRATEQAALFASVHVVSKTVDWAKQTTRQVVLEGRVLGVQDIETLFDTEARLNTNVSLQKVYEETHHITEHRDGTWKAKVFLLAEEEKLIADAQAAIQKLEEDIESSRVNAERAVRVLKSRLREKMRQAEAAALLPQKLGLMAEALELYRQFQEAEASIQKARQAYAAGDGALAFIAYQEVPGCEEDAPPDDSPVPSADRSYQQMWESVRDAVRTLESAQKRADARELVSAQKLLDEFYQRMGDATGPFTHADTGEILSLSPLPSLLGEQLEALRQKEKSAFQRGESAFAAGDVVTAMTALHEAQKADRENSQAQQRLDQIMRIFATATLEADPAELVITSRVLADSKLNVYLKASDGRALPVPIAFRFEESGVDAEMVTDLLDGVSSDGSLAIKKIHQSPADTNKLRLLAVPSPRSMGGLDNALTARLQSVLENHIISIPVTLKPATLGLLLNFTGDGMAEGRVSQFTTNLESRLRQKKYDIAGEPGINTMEIQGSLRMDSAPVGPLVTLNLSITLACWYDNRSLAAGVQLSSGAQIDESEDAAFALAQSKLMEKCEEEIERRMKQALGE